MDARKEVVEAFIQATLKDHVLSEGMPRTSVDTQDAYQTVELLRALCAKVENLEARVAAADKLAGAMKEAIEDLVYFIPNHSGSALTDAQVQEDVADYIKALAAYQATKE